MSVDRNDIDDALNLLDDMRGLAESILDNLGELSGIRDELVTSYEDALEVGKYIEGIEREWGGGTLVTLNWLRLPLITALMISSTLSRT